MQWISNILEELSLSNLKQSILYTDSDTLVTTITRFISQPKQMKHILSRIAYLQQSYRNEDIDLRWIPTENMIADCLTKSLSARNYLSLHARRLGIVNNPTSEDA